MQAVPPVATIAESSTLCVFCKKDVGRYACPKCRIRYCSVPCYKVHSDHCVEVFYQENVIEHMKSSAASERDKAEMMKILQRMQELDDKDEDEDDPAAEQSSVPWAEVLERVERGEDVLPSLPASVRADFERALKDGRLSEELTEWEPWWTSAARITAIPVITPLSIPPITSLIRNPSPLLIYGLVDLVFTYSIVKRLWHGEWTHDTPGAASAALQLSAVLSGKAPHSCTLEAMSSVSECAPGRTTH